MAARNVNLDALIPREDFLVTAGGPAVGESGKAEVTATDLKKDESFYSGLRKPDFQRETAAWKPPHVLALIKAFVEGDLIPSVICWQSPARLSFVIDGAHRLSAIIAWLTDDYGQGEISSAFYNYQVSEDQRKVALATQRLVNDKVGSYADIMKETANPGYRPDLADYGAALAHAKIQLQWITKSESEKAEQAFFTINQSAVKIDATELKILDTRFKPNAIIARAIVRNANGHKYWGTFTEPSIEKIEKQSKSINELLFTPPLKSPVRSMELPIAGHGYGAQSLPLIYELINLANKLPVEDASAYKIKEPDPDNPKVVIKPDEQTTVKLTKNTLKLCRLVTGNLPMSLGLHPAVYFYSASGRHQPTAVLAIAAIVLEMESKKQFNQFSEARKDFEEFVVNHKDFVNQITRKYGSMAKGYKMLKLYFEQVLEQCMASKAEAEIEKFLFNHEKFTFLQLSNSILTTKSRDFSQNAKQFAFLKESLDAAITCKICGARKDSKAMTSDHSDDKKDGGLASVDNLDFVHPYCNSAFKDYKRSKK